MPVEIELVNMVVAAPGRPGIRSWNHSIPMPAIIRFMLQRQADAVQAVNHAVAAEAVELERIDFIASGDRLRFQVYREADAGLVRNQSEQLIHFLFA